MGLRWYWRRRSRRPGVAKWVARSGPHSEGVASSSLNEWMAMRAGWHGGRRWAVAQGAEDCEGLVKRTLKKAGWPQEEAGGCPRLAGHRGRRSRCRRRPVGRRKRWAVAQGSQDIEGSYVEGGRLAVEKECHRARLSMRQEGPVGPRVRKTSRGGGCR